VFAFARARLYLARHRWLRWAVAALLAAVAGLSTAAASARVEVARRRWGEARTVWIAVADLEPGTAVRGERRRVPAAVVPVGALGELPAGAIAHQHVGRGEMLTVVDIAVPGWLPQGDVALAIPVEAPPALTPGARVRIFAAGAAIADGRVVAVGDATVTVAVPEPAAPAVSAAAAARAAVLGALPG
jgi:hypothetical protein